MSNYIPVPVEAAKAIGDTYKKSIVLILAWDPVHRLTNVTTFGENESDKLNAAAFGERVATEAGIATFERKRSEDFRAEILRDWLNGEFRQALRDPEQIQAACAMLKVSRDKGDAAEKCVATAIADFVKSLIEKSAVTR